MSLVGERQEPARAAHASDLTPETAASILAMAVWSFDAYRTRRFYGQHYWHQETLLAKEAIRVEGDLPLENIAEHSWHVADMALVIAPHIQGLDVQRCVALAALHDKLELLMGDWSPVGADGTGNATHAFDAVKRKEKLAQERLSLRAYLEKLPTAAREVQEPLFLELLDGETREARFVRAVDKLQALVFVLVKKDGRMNDDHICFTLQYSASGAENFAPLRPVFMQGWKALLERVASYRGVSVEHLKAGYAELLA